MGLCLRRLRLQDPLQGWQGSTGISGSFQSGDSSELASRLPCKGKSVRNRGVSQTMPFLVIPRSLLRGGFNRNQWQPSPGIGGRVQSESVATFARNTQRGSSKRGSWISTVLKVGAPGRPCTFSERIIVGPESRWSLSLPAFEDGDDRGPEGLGHHLQLLALLWLWVLLLGVGRWGRDGTSPTPLPPVKSFKNRSQELPRLAGLLPKPLWAACEQAAPSRPPAPWAPPPRLSGPRGRRRTGDPPQQGCPEEAHSSDGWGGPGPIGAYLSI